ncbi:MAG TPA: polysaccharide biosynthesis/export family protein, partial [Candidatus Polarisedimenticolia bacterium]|nr:polysaccharide biosynthesis/export family protein [Candidatus Polarisedimenticolia bacterium]
AAAAAPPADGTLSLTSVTVAPEGRLLAVRLKAAEPIERYTLARQGPPEKRDLVVRLPGMADRTAGPADTGDFLLPITLSREGEGDDGALAIVLGGVGDSLVSVTHDRTDLSLVIIPPVRRSEAAEAYRVGINDVLQVDVFGHEELNKTLKVSPRGSINFPMIGPVKADGRTVDDIASEITERLAADYLHDPRVSVSVWEYLSQWVNVMGEVSQPGRYPLTGPTRLIDALSQAGGLTERAGGEILVMRRPEEVDPASAGEVFKVDVKALFGGDGDKLNVKLRTGDVIHVIPGDSARAVRP